MRETNFAGRDGFVWFVGVVEDRMDPLKAGRVRVRALGWHTEDKNLIPTEDLPWANVMQPTTSASMCGVGETPLGLVPGSWVVGFFVDGPNAQDPLVVGSIPGIPINAADKDSGFSDPRDNDKLNEKLATAPREITRRQYHFNGEGVELTQETQAKPNPRILNEPDTNRLARNEQITETIIQVKRNNRDASVPIAFGGDWTEPRTTYAAVFPFNHVRQSESGHIEEVDDTPGAERTHRWNRTGTCEEIITDGSKIVKVVGDNYEILLKDDLIHVMGNKTETCDQAYDLKVTGSFNIQVEGNVNLEVQGSVYEKVVGDVNQTVNGNVLQKISGDLEQRIEGDIVQDVSGSIEQNVHGNIVQKVSGNVDARISKKWQVKASAILFDAPLLSLNGGFASPSAPLSPSSPEEPKQ